MPRPAVSPPAPRGHRQPADPHRWQRRASPLARYALLVYALIVVDASLFPFSGWRSAGAGPYDYLFAAWPNHALPFDLVVNMLGYLPLGFVAGLAMHPRLRGVAMVLAATLVCGALSIELESIQTYLPARVASPVDVVANVVGGLAGALIAARTAHALLDTGRLRVWRTRWFAGDASRGLALTLVWFGALVYPDAFVLGMGGLLKAFDPAVAASIASAVGLADVGDPLVAAERFQRAESIVAGSALLGVGGLFLNLQRPGLSWRGRVALLAGFVATTVAIVALSHAFVFDDAVAWPPLTPGARSGVAIAAAVLVVATFVPRRVRWALALAAMLAWLVVVNVYPDNPYENAVGLAWTRGKLLNFYGLASGLNLVWPFAAIAYLLRHRPRDAIVPRRIARGA